MKIEELLNELEDYLEDCSSIPLTGKIIVDKQDIFAILDEIRDLLPEEIVQAGKILSEKQRILVEAQRERERMLQEAEEHIGRIVNEHQVVKEAQQKASQIVEEAKNIAREIRLGANQYADEILKNLEANLEKTLATTKRGRQELKNAVGE